MAPVSTYEYNISQLDNESSMYFIIENNIKIFQNYEVLGMDIQIAQQVQGLGYVIASIDEHEINEFEEKFRVITVELKNEINDYSALLKQEREISRKLNLYGENIILELV